MQIVIDISEEEYQTYINHTEAILDSSIPLVHQDLLRAVINGTPLPEGHGRLIDADKLRAEYIKPHLVGYDEIIEDIDRQPTVVEGEGVWSDNV